LRFDEKHFDDKFYERMWENPTALELPFWENHFCTREALDTNQLYGKILDVGCGTGEIDIFLARSGREVIGLDFSKVGLEVAEKHLSLELKDVQRRCCFINADAEHIPFEGNTFDSVLFSHILEHLYDPSTILIEITRVLKPDGNLLVLVPLEMAHNDSGHVHYFNALSLSKVLSSYFAEVTTGQSDYEGQLKALAKHKK